MNVLGTPSSCDCLRAALQQAEVCQNRCRLPHLNAMRVSHHLNAMRVYRQRKLSRAGTLTPPSPVQWMQMTRPTAVKARWLGYVLSQVEEHGEERLRFARQDKILGEPDWRQVSMLEYAENLVGGGGGVGNHGAGAKSTVWGMGLWPLQVG